MPKANVKVVNETPSGLNNRVKINGTTYLNQTVGRGQLAEASFFLMKGDEDALVESLNEIKKKLDGKTIIFKVKTGADDKVFGTISNKQISEKLKDMGYKIDKKCIKSDAVISSLGVTKVSVELHKKVKFDLNVELVK